MNEKEAIKRKIIQIKVWGSYIGDAIAGVLSYLFKHQEQNEESIDDLYEQTAQRQLEIKILRQANERLSKLIAKNREDVQKLYENPAHKG